MRRKGSKPTHRLIADKIGRVINESKGRGAVASAAKKFSSDLVGEKERRASDFLTGMQVAKNLVTGDITEEEAIAHYMETLGVLGSWELLASMGVTIDPEKFYQWDNVREEPKETFRITLPTKINIDLGE